MNLALGRVRNRKGFYPVVKHLFAKSKWGRFKEKSYTTGAILIKFGNLIMEHLMTNTKIRIPTTPYTNDTDTPQREKGVEYKYSHRLPM